MKMIFAALSVCLGTLLLSTAALATPIPNDFTSQEPDAAAIRSLLERYTRAVSTKDQALFESLLLNKMIPFSSAGQAIKGGATDAGTRNYNDFRQGVFEGPAFTQSFRDIHIEQDGALASVSLVFINSADNGSSWGYKTMQLLKVDGQWRIASEFFTAHALQ